jgi:hypothetical protein
MKNLNNENFAILANNLQVQSQQKNEAAQRPKSAAARNLGNSTN